MNKRIKFFSIAFFASVAVFMVLLCFGIEAQQRILYASGGELMSDFFHNVLFSYGLDPYFGGAQGSHLLREHIYPPICYIVLTPFVRMFDVHFGTTLQNLHENLVAMVTGTALTVFFTIVFIVLMRKMLRNYSVKYDWLYVVILLTSGICAFATERANFVTVAAIGILLFLMNYRKSIRGGGILAAIGLSVAVALKIYPIFFLALALRDKRYKMVIAVIIGSFILGFMPIMFLHHHSVLENVLQLMANVKQQGIDYFAMCVPNLSVPSYVNAGFRVWKIDAMWLVNFLRVLQFVIGCIAILGIWFTDREWKRWFLAAAAGLFISGFGVFYVLLYFLPAIFLYLSSNEGITHSDYIVLPAFWLCLTPLQFGRIPIVYDSINPFLIACCIWLVTLWILCDIVLNRKTNERDATIAGAK